MSSLSALFPSVVRLQGGATAYQVDTGGYFIDFVPKGPQLVISFEHLAAGGLDGRRNFWGYSYFAQRDYSVLGVKWKNLDYYRGKDLHRFFKSDEFQNFARQFSQHAWLGCSMGGFAALAFSEVLPGSLIFAQSPISTRDPRIVPWDKNNQIGARQDWSGDFTDAATASLASRKIYLLYDPFQPNDQRHAQRIAGPNVVYLKLPFGGHEAVKLLPQMNLLGEVTDLALNETLTAAHFAKLVRARRSIPFYYQQLFTQAKTSKFKQTVLKHGLKLDPLDGELLSLAIRHYFLHGKFSACVQLFQNSGGAEMVPAAKRRLIKACVGTAMSRLHYPISWIKKLADETDNESGGADELLLQAEFLHIVGEYDRSARLAQVAVGRNPRRHDSYRRLALAQEAQGLIGEAMTTLNEGERSCGFLGHQMKLIKARLQTGQV